MSDVPQTTSVYIIYMLTLYRKKTAYSLSNVV